MVRCWRLSGNLGSHRRSPALLVRPVHLWLAYLRLNVWERTPRFFLTANHFLTQSSFSCVRRMDSLLIGKRLRWREGVPYSRGVQPDSLWMLGDKGTEGSAVKLQAGSSHGDREMTSLSREWKHSSWRIFWTDLAVNSSSSSLSFSLILHFLSFLESNHSLF